MKTENKRNFFQLIENAFKRTLPNDKVWVVRLDAKDSKSVNNIFDDTKGSFTGSLCYVAKLISNNFPNAIVYTESDEISIMFIDTTRILEKIGKPDSNKLVSYVGQYVAKEFNSIYKTKYTFFDVKPLPIPQHRVLSYLKYRMIYAENFTINHYASKVNFKSRKGKKNDYMKDKLKDYGVEWDKLPAHNRMGSLFVNGNKIDFDRNHLVEALEDDFDIENNYLFPRVDSFTFEG